MVITLLVTNSNAKLGIAGLTAVGAALSGYIARTYLRVYGRAQDQLNFYFREPLIMSYLLNAERLAEKLTGDRREEIYAEMVREIERLRRRFDSAGRFDDQRRHVARRAVQAHYAVMVMRSIVSPGSRCQSIARTPFGYRKSISES